MVKQLECGKTMREQEWPGLQVTIGLRLIILLRFVIPTSRLDIAFGRNREDMSLVVGPVQRAEQGG